MVKSKPSGSKKQLFDPESESSDGECSRDSDALEDTLSSAALNFGWHKLHEAAKARFAKEVSAAGKQEKPKRHYDNSKRAARAAYERTAGKFKENGLSSERITGVLAMDECLCDMYASSIWYLVDAFTLICNSFPHALDIIPNLNMCPSMRRRQNMLQPVQREGGPWLHARVLGALQD